ncbi:MAG: N-acetylmuramoyl-L-alanine amidase [Candidatus Humimicrobiaceae bacterium]
MTTKNYKINYSKIIVCVVLLVILAFSFLFFNIKGNTIDAGQVAVFIDPGHGGGDTGAIQNGYLEKNVNLAISLKVKSILEANGYRVIMRRTNDSGMSMDNIISTANASGANLFVSIHSNSAFNQAAQGIETYWSASNTAGGSSQLATAIHNAVVQASGRPGRVLRSAEFKVIKYTNIPAALVECGFLSNPDEAALLNSEDYQNRVAQGIVNGIRAYVSSAGVSGNATAATTAGGETLTGDVLVNVDAPSNNQVVSGILNLQGWAIDRSATATTGITAVHVYDGPANGQANFIGQATLGIARPDVAASFGKGNLTPSGFNLSIDTNKLAKGTHVLHIYANNAAVGWKYVTVVVNVVNDGSAPAQTGTQGSTVTPVTQTPVTTTTTVSNAPAAVNTDGSYASSGSKRVLINIDSPKNNENINGRLKIEGWALETSAQNSTGITAVHVYDGPANGQANFIGQATYGIPRPDVANNLGGRAGFTNSGFTSDFDASKLSAGPHNIYVYANNYYLGWQFTVVKINIGGTGTTSQVSTTSSASNSNQTVKVAAVSSTNTNASESTGKGKVLINIDTPKANQSVNGSFALTGWALETSSVNSTGITAMHIYDGPANGEKNFITAATYGVARPDVAGYYGKANFANCGFNAEINLSKLANGPHTLYVYAYNSSQGWKFATVNINVGSGGGTTQAAAVSAVNTQVSSSGGSGSSNSSNSNGGTQSINIAGPKLILINIDTPSENSSVGGSFEISGWAADKNSNSGTGINGVHIYDGPANGPQNMLGVANYGIARADVASALGNGNITNSGFKLTIDGSKLTQGQHTIYVYANNPEIGWKYATLKINVTSNGGGSQSAAATTGGSVSGGTNIVGYVPVSIDQLLRPFVARGSGQIDRARRLADLYIKWGQAFNIRADIAWAQMCHETGFLEFTGVARPEWNNFAGIGITGPGAMVTFASEELGVIAHYAHLAWYVYPNDINAYCNRNYDPRHIGTHRFNGDSSLNTLNSRWAPAADYVNKIVYFANQIWG